MTEADMDIIRRAVAVWGDDAQAAMAIEEAAELIVAIRHWRRGRGDTTALASEIADVQIMLHQLALMIGPELVETQISRKVGRLASRVNVAETKALWDDLNEAAKAELLRRLSASDLPKGYRIEVGK